MASGVIGNSESVMTLGSFLAAKTKQHLDKMSFVIEIRTFKSKRPYSG